MRVVDGFLHRRPVEFLTRAAGADPPLEAEAVADPGDVVAAGADQRVRAADPEADLGAAHVLAALDGDREDVAALAQALADRGLELADAAPAAAKFGAELVPV